MRKKRRQEAKISELDGFVPCIMLIMQASSWNNDLYCNDTMTNVCKTKRL